MDLAEDAVRRAFVEARGDAAPVARLEEQRVAVAERCHRLIVAAEVAVDAPDAVVGGAALPAFAEQPRAAQHLVETLQRGVEVAGACERVAEAV